MSTIIVNQSEPSFGNLLPLSSETFHSSLDDHSAQSDEMLPLGSNTSRVLIVDDTPDILKLVSKMATCLGYHPTMAEDGLDALYFLTRHHYDLVITDYDMPFIDGYQLADQIKEKYFETKVIIMIGHCEKDLRELIEGSGIVDGLLLKPFNLENLKEKVETVIQPHFGKWTC